MSEVYYSPKEEGADLVVQIRNPFDNSPWLIIVQVKNYRERIGADVANQLRRAHEYYGKGGTVLALVAMTTAEEIGDDLAKASSALQAELKVPVNVVLRKETMKILADGLMARPAWMRSADETEDV